MFIPGPLESSQRLPLKNETPPRRNQSAASQLQECYQIPREGPACRSDFWLFPVPRWLESGFCPRARRFAREACKGLRCTDRPDLLLNCSPDRRRFLPFFSSFPGLHNGCHCPFGLPSAPSLRLGPMGAFRTLIAMVGLSSPIRQAGAYPGVSGKYLHTPR